jgi:hypothetical protein
MTFIKIRSHRRKFSNSDSVEQKKIIMTPYFHGLPWIKCNTDGRPNDPIVDTLLAGQVIVGNT